MGTQFSHGKRHSIPQLSKFTAAGFACVHIVRGPCLFPNGWTDRDVIWYAGRSRPTPHCIRWGPSSPSPKRAQPPIFGPRLLWTNGRPSQLLLSTWSYTHNRICNVLHRKGLKRYGPGVCVMHFDNVKSYLTAMHLIHRVSSILITYWHLISHSRIMPAQQHLVTSWHRAVQTFMKMSLEQFDYTTGRGRRWNLQHDLTSLLHHATSNPPSALSSYRLTAQYSLRQRHG